MISRIRLPHIFAVALGVTLAAVLIWVLSVQTVFGDERQNGQLDDEHELATEASLSVDDAIAIARAEVPGAVDDVELDRVGDRLIYEIEVGAFDVHVDANDGSVLFVDRDSDDGDRDDRDKQNRGEPAITRDEAIAAAEAEVSGPVTGVELDDEAGRLVWTVEIGRQEVHVDALDGTILSVEHDD